MAFAILRSCFSSIHGIAASRGWAWVVLLILGGTAGSGEPVPEVRVRQITTGPEHHFFGYIGHVQNIPWNASGRYILALQTTFQDHLPGPDEPANVVVIDTEKDYSVRVVDRSMGWNPQQGTMFYWNPESPETQFFFNDRDPKTGKVFCVLFDLSKGPAGARIREYRFGGRPIGNGGVAQNGGSWLGINYARMARLRPVTGYRGTYDWTEGVLHPEDDGIFRVHARTGRRQLLVSFARLAEVLRPTHPRIDRTALFINHTLWNREDDRIFFFARGGWSGNSPRGERINQPFVMQSDGSNLRPLARHIGGHPEWDFGRRLIGRWEDSQIVYDPDRDLVVGRLGNPEIFPNPEGDIALSPNGEWFVNGHKDRERSKTFYTFLRRLDGAHVRSPGIDIGQWQSGDLRLDPAPCWNRKGDQILVTGLSQDGSGTRQMFLISMD